MKGRLCGGRLRARSDEDKALRERQILDSAQALFTSQSFHTLTLADVAQEAGLTKAALYRYFRSKELLFLAVYRRAVSALVDDIETIGAEGFPTRFTDTLIAHEVFCGLSAILHIALETGLSEQEAREFKLFLLHRINRITALVQRATGRDEAGCFQYLMQCQQALIGCWHMTHPSEQAAKAMATPPLDVFRQPFSTALRSHLAVLTAAFLDAPTPVR